MQVQHESNITFDTHKTNESFISNDVTTAQNLYKKTEEKIGCYPYEAEHFIWWYINFVALWRLIVLCFTSLLVKYNSDVRFLLNNDTSIY